MESILAERPQFDEKLLDASGNMDGFEAYTGPHGSRITEIADSIGAAFNLASRDRFFLQQTALVHDIGEVVMNRDYICSTRTLSASERIDLQRHPVIGEQETAKLSLPRAVQLIVRWHHEWWNGSGYPDMLESEQIPLAARILRLADTYAALTVARPFRAAMTTGDARKYISEWAGIEFDPAVAKAFLAIEEPSAVLSESSSFSAV